MEENDKVYGAFKLPPRDSGDENIERMSHEERCRKRSISGDEISFQDGMYYEIEYDASPVSGVGEFVQKTQKLPEPERDEVKELFSRMRDIARRNRVLVFGNSRFYDRKAKQQNSAVFYRQGMFMKDFEDDFEETVPYMEYYPCYQMMGYRQLRTYFTWRTKVRKGKVDETSLSYAYLYIYELLNNIGVEDPQDGLDKLLAFWKEFRVYQPAVNKYMPQWLKDYYIYYDLPMTFSEFVAGYNLGGQYPELSDSEDKFGFFCSVSKYDIRKSGFYGEGREALIRDCFDFTFDRLGKVFAGQGIDFEGMIFLPAKSMAVWTPFQEALFHPWRVQRDRQVAISAREVYVCSGNLWNYRTALATESGRQLMGCVLKLMESVLRQAVKYKYKITAGLGGLSPMTVKLLEDAGISLEQCTTGIVKEFYREVTRTVVTVDRDRLAKIREEALQTQEKLIVSEDEGAQREVLPKNIDPGWNDKSMEENSKNSNTQEMNPWDELKQALTETELGALRLILCGDADVKQFADSHGVMLEVLADGINEKAADTVGDSILDDEFAIYDDYLEQVKEMLGE